MKGKARGEGYCSVGNFLFDIATNWQYFFLAIFRSRNGGLGIRPFVFVVVFVVLEPQGPRFKIAKKAKSRKK